MSSYDKLYTIKEYSGFTRVATVLGYQPLSEEKFDALEAFILANNSGGKTEAVDLLSLSVRRGIGKIITARNYVGLITLKDGTVIEILPKIAGRNVTIDDTKRIFLEMLKVIKDVTFKDFNVSGVDTDRLSLLEIFIKMFLDEVAILTKQGLKAAYTQVESNERYFKGKLITSKNIVLNLATAAIKDFLSEHDIDVFLAVFDKAAFNISEKMLGEVAEYIDEHYVDEHWDKQRERRLLDVEMETLNSPTPQMICEKMLAPTPGLDDLVGDLDEPFSATLLRLIDAKGKTDVEVYNARTSTESCSLKSGLAKDICLVRVLP